MKKYFWMLLAVMAMALIVDGCSKKQPPVDTSKVFDSADATIKGYWEKALAAYKANDYAGALALLQVLRNEPSLTPEQWNTAQEMFSTVMDKAIEAANRGDANGQKAVEFIKQLRGR